MSRLLLILLKRPPLLTPSQLDKLADAFINIGTLFFGAMVVPFFVFGVDKPPVLVLVLGSGLSGTFFLLALVSVRRVRL